MSKVIRSVKNVTKGYSSVQIKVREATSNDPWGPTGTQMAEIAQLTFNSSTEFYEIMDMIDKRLNDKGKNWRHVLKALKCLDYCLHEGSELVVTWSRQNIFVIKTLREFIYVDEEGRDVGQNVRVAAKELTSLILDEERLRAERSDRKTWKSRVTGLDEHGPPPGEPTRQRRERARRHSDPDDAEYKLAIEASKFQEEEDRRHRESRHGGHDDDDDDDLAKAIKLSKEEEDRRRRELEESHVTSLFDDDLIQTAHQPQYTGFNQGYQQGNAVDFFANPIDQNQMQAQPTGYMGNAYTGFQAQPTGFQPQPTGFHSYPNGFGTQPNGFDPYGQQNNQQQQQQQQPLAFQPQPTGYNPYAQQQQQQAAQPPLGLEPSSAPGSNNPWATNNNQQQQQGARLTPTGSNNPFASSSPFGRPQLAKASTLGSLPEQKTLSSFSQPSLSLPQQQQQPGREMNEHETKLNALLAGGEGQDTFGNTGQLRIPAQHTAPGTFVNSAGAGLSRLTTDATGSNPFLRTQFTGMPNVSYGGAGAGGGGGVQFPAATGPAGLNGFGMGGAQGNNNNPFGRQQAPQYSNQGDLIQF